MTLYGEPQVWREHFPLGEARPFTQDYHGLRPAIGDPRIVLCLPASGLSRRRGRLTGELGSIRETQTLYSTSVYGIPDRWVFMGNQSDMGNLG